MNQKDIEIEVLFTQEQLLTRVAELGREISADYLGKDLTLVGVLKGSFVFISDLARKIEVPAVVDFVKISSYGSSLSHSGRCDIQLEPSTEIEGRHVLVVEDIVDTGLTLSHLLGSLAEKKPASLKVCTLLHKPSGTRVQVNIDYCGFTVPDGFVIGYGLDYMDYYRGMPYIGTIKNQGS